MNNHRYDQVIVVDWSASAVPKLGKDSIWLCAQTAEGRQVVNLATRCEAMALLASLVSDPNKRTLVAFDICFGYPRGTVAALGLSDWWALWQRIASLTRDDTRNANNRFDVAKTLNDRLPSPLFWGCPKAQQDARLSMRRPEAWPLPEYRWTELGLRRAQSPWKLMYVGAVGSQTLLGIARLVPWIEQLRMNGRQVSVWPYQPPTGQTGEIVLAETYLSLFETGRAGVKDEGQVIDTADALFGARVARYLARPYRESAEVWAEEAWTLGLV